MWETVIVIAVVVVAAAGVGYGLYRNAAGKGGCSGCANGDCKEAEESS